MTCADAASRCYGKWCGDVRVEGVGHRDSPRISRDYVHNKSKFNPFCNSEILFLLCCYIHGGQATHLKKCPFFHAKFLSFGLKFHLNICIHICIKLMLYNTHTNKHTHVECWICCWLEIFKIILEIWVKFSCMQRAFCFPTLSQMTEHAGTRWLNLSYVCLCLFIDRPKIKDDKLLHRGVIVISVLRQNFVISWQYRPIKMRRILSRKQQESEKNMHI